MSDPVHLKIIKQGVETWNEWRRLNQHVFPINTEVDDYIALRAILPRADLSNADLSRADLSSANLSRAELTRANLQDANLNGANLIGASLFQAPLRGANLVGADLRFADLTNADISDANLGSAKLNHAELIDVNLQDANLNGAFLEETRLWRANLRGATLRLADLTNADIRGADLSRADLSGANLSGADLSGANLSGANLSGASLIGTKFDDANLKEANLTDAELCGAGLYNTNFSGANLIRANLSGAYMGNTILTNVDLREVKGLENVNHHGPSSIGIDTIYKSQGEIPVAFLRGAGVPDNFIEYVHSLTGSALVYYKCFISHSTKDKDFAERLHADLQDKGVRCWFAIEDLQGGKQNHEQITEAIRVHDKLLLVLSENSMGSEWVKTEIREAKKCEEREKTQKFFPIAIVPYQFIKEWTLFDSDSGVDLAAYIRSYFIPDFSEWKQHGKYQKEFERLLDALKADKPRKKQH